MYGCPREVCHAHRNPETPEMSIPPGDLPGAAFLQCTATGERLPSEQLIGLSPAGKPLFRPLQPCRARRPVHPPRRRRPRAPPCGAMPRSCPCETVHVESASARGFTPLVESPRLARTLQVGRLWVKDEGQNPTGSFKDRGLCMAVSRALELGARGLAIPSAGNAAGAAAAYGAAAGLPVHVVVPTDTPVPILAEIRALGAEVRLLDGLIGDCGAVVRRRCDEDGWWDLSTLKEPYRVEGKKTMGYELFEQLGGRLPDAIVYPTGGGTGLIGMWKAFAEMEALGWIGRRRPRMFSVQAAGCAPVVQAWERGWEEAGVWEDAATYAAGLRVPGP